MQASPQLHVWQLLLPALAGSMSHADQPLAAGTTVTARLAVAVLVPLAEVTVCRTPTVTVPGDTAEGLHQRMCHLPMRQDLQPLIAKLLAG